MMIIGGSSHPELTELIARKVGVKPGRIVLGKFANQETQVQLTDNVRGQDVYVIQTGGVSSNDAIVELLLIINSCKLASAESVTVITPFYPYSKSDQKSCLRSPITSKLVANMLQKAGTDHLMMLEPHSPQLVGFFDRPVDALKVEPIFCTWIKQHIRGWRSCIVVAPDEGSAKRSVMIANSLELEFAMIHNRHKNSINKNSSVLSRDGSVCSDDDLIHIVGVEPPECLRLTHNMVDKLLKISGDVTGLDCIVVDDMLDTGATARLALEVLQIHGARKVYIFATHGIFSGEAANILKECSNLEKVVVTNSLPQERNIASMGNLLDVVDISGMISEFIRRCHYRESVSVLVEVDRELEPREMNHHQVLNGEEAEVRREEVGGHQGNRLVRRGFRLESVCWDN